MAKAEAQTSVSAFQDCQCIILPMIHAPDSSAFKLYLAIMLQEIGGILQPPLLKLSVQLLISSIFQVIIASHTCKQLLHIQRIIRPIASVAVA